MPAQRIVITGANRGLGLGFVRSYLRAGAQIVATARDLDAADDLIALGEDHADLLKLVRCDVTDALSVGGLVAELPWPAVDLLINNSGIGGGGPQEDLGAVDFDSVRATFEVNTLGPMRVTRAMWPVLEAATATIVHVSSLMGSIADSSGGRYDYRISKAALNMAVRCLGHECRPLGMTTFAIHPGWVRTEMGGRAAPLSVDESVAAMVATIRSKGVADNGGFFDRDGAVLPW